MRTFIISVASLFVFTGLAQATIHEVPPELDIFGAIKAEIWFQSETNTVTLVPFNEFDDSPYEFIVFYDPSSGETVTSISFSGGLAFEDPLGEALDGIFDLTEDVPHHFASRTLLNADYPDSDPYVFTIDTSLSGSPFTVPLSFGASDAYFVAPQLSNSGITGGVLKFNFNQDFTFNWNTPDGFEDGTDRLFLFIDEPIVDGGFILAVDKWFSVFQNSYTLAANTLDPLKTYEMELIFGNVVGPVDLSVPGHAGIAAFGTITFLELMHVPEPGTYSLIFGLAALGFVVLRRRRS